MTFKVNSAEIRAYCGKLQELYKDVEGAKNYVHGNGDFSFHEAGVIGVLAGRHADFMRRLEELHNQLLTILGQSGDALTAIADTYDAADAATSARIDATYPASPRPAPRRD